MRRPSYTNKQRSIRMHLELSKTGSFSTHRGLVNTQILFAAIETKRPFCTLLAAAECISIFYDDRHDFLPYQHNGSTISRTTGLIMHSDVCQSARGYLQAPIDRCRLGCSPGWMMQSIVKQQAFCECQDVLPSSTTTYPCLFCPPK